MPAKSRKRYEPKIFGFKVHYAATIARWQDAARRAQRNRLQEAGTIAEGHQLFVEDAESSDGGAEDRVEELEDDEAEAIVVGGEGEGVVLQGGAAATTASQAPL